MCAFIISVMCLNHSETTLLPSAPGHGKIVFHITSPWCQKGWWPLGKWTTLPDGPPFCPPSRATVPLPQSLLTLMLPNRMTSPFSSTWLHSTYLLGPSLKLAEASPDCAHMPFWSLSALSTHPCLNLLDKLLQSRLTYVSLDHILNSSRAGPCLEPLHRVSWC